MHKDPKRINKRAKERENSEGKRQREYNYEFQHTVNKSLSIKD